MKNWKKSVVAAATALLLGVSLMGCGAKKAESGAAESATTAAAAAESASATGTAAESAAAAKTEAGAGLRVGALKGPTAMGLAALMQESQDGKSEGSYQFTVAAQPDEIAAKIVSGDLDIALLPANMAAALYNKTEGKIAVLNINTLGVLYCVTGDENIHSVKDLAGKTVAVQIGTTSAKEVKKNPDIQVKELNSSADTFLELKAGGVQAVVNARPVNDYYIAKSGEKDVRVVNELLTSEDYGIAMAKDNQEMQKKVNDALKKLKENGKYDESYKKGFGKKAD